MAIEIFDKGTSLRIIPSVLSASVCDKLDGTLTLDFSALQEGQEPIKPDMTAKLKGQYYNIVRVKRGFSSGLEMSTVSCEHISYILNNEEYNLVTFVFEGMPTEGLAELLQGTPFTVGKVEPNTMVECAFTEDSPLNRRSALMRFADACGGELEYDGYAINIVLHRGSHEPVELMDGKNVTSLSCTLDSRQKTQAYEIELFKRVNISVGDEVHITYKPLSIDVGTRIVGLTYNPFDVHTVRVEVGDYVPNLLAAETQRLQGIRQEFRAANGRLESTIQSVEGNLSSLEQTVSGFDLRIQNAEDAVASLTLTVNGFDVRIENAEGAVSTLSVKVNGFDTRIADAEGAVSQMSQTVSGFNTRISDAEGAVSQVSQTVSGFSTRISNAEGAVSDMSRQLDKFSSSVVTVDNSGNFVGTAIEQNYEYVRIAWNQLSETIQFENGGIYIKDKNGQVLVVLDKEGIVAEKGIFKGKLQSGDLSKYGVVIDEGVIKGYTNSQMASYISSNQAITIDNITKYGLRFAGQGGITLRGPYLGVSKDYLPPEQGGTVEFGVDSTIRPITDFTTVGEGENRKLQFTYGNVRFVNGICVSTTSGAGTATTDLPEQQAPVGDNTYQADAEEVVKSHIVDTAYQERFIDSSVISDGSTAYPTKFWSLSWTKDLIINCNDIRTTNTNCPHFSNGWIDISSGYGGDFPIIRSFPGVMTVGVTSDAKWSKRVSASTSTTEDSEYYSCKRIWLLYVGQNNGVWYISDIYNAAPAGMRVSIENIDTGVATESHQARMLSMLYRSRFLTNEEINPNRRGWMASRPTKTANLFEDQYKGINLNLVKNNWGYDAPMGVGDYRLTGAGNYLGVQVFWQDGALFMLSGVCFKEGNRVYWSDAYVSQNGKQRYTPIINPNAPVPSNDANSSAWYNRMAVVPLKVNLTKNKLYAFDTLDSAQQFSNYLKSLKE